MISREWLEETLEYFKSAPNSIKIFDEIRRKLSENTNLNLLLESPEESVSSYCGIRFKKDQLLYHCSDCALDETCVLCEKCFNFDAHKDHNYWYTIGSNNSGSCDCGEEDSWKNDLKCPHHSYTQAGSNCNSKLEDIDTLRVALKPILSIVTKLFYKYGTSRNEARSDDCILILYNDENHSFEDVIDVLTTEIEITVEEAMAYATLVDTKGFAPILISSATTCQRIGRKFKTLVTSVEDIETAFGMILTTEIVSILSEKSSFSSSLRSIFVEWFLSDFEEVPSMKNLGIIFSFDHLLWKSVRLNFNEILNSCNAIDQESKKLIALTYCKNYNKIFDAFLKEKRESHLSVTNFSVQIFTLIPVAEFCLENSDILAELIGKMIEILEPGFNPSAGLDFAKLRGFNFQKFSVLTHDALHITRNIKSKILKIPNLNKTVDSFMYLLNLLTHMQGHFIKTGDHVTYDRDNYDNANYICFEIQQIAQEFAKIIVNNCDLSSIWSLFDKHIDQKPSLCKLLNNNNTEEKIISPLFKSRKRCSFFGSLAWFYASVVREALKRGDEDLRIPSKIVKCFAIDSLSRIIFSAEVRSGLWVRNGLIVRQQEYFYSSTVYHNLTYFQDLYNCIIGSRLIDKIPFIEMIIKHSCVIEYLQNQDQTGPVIDQFMIIFINCCSNQEIDLDSDQILINSLCTEALTKSSLVKILPECVSEASELRLKLQEMARLTSVNAIGVDAKLEITKQYLDQFDPFYWAFAMNFRLKAWSTFKEKRRSHSDLLHNIFMKKYPISSEITKEADFLIEMLLNFADSASTDHEFSLEMVLIILKAITNITSDQECLDRVSKCIEKFKLKKNIPDHILTFLASICPATPDVVMSDANAEQKAQNRREKRSNIMASFKRQRDAFMAEPQATLDEDDQICVVCSESGCGGNEESFLAVPFQLTESSLMLHGEKKGTFLRGCHHLIHNTCFKSLPGQDFKKCTLCNSLINHFLPLFSEPQYFGPKEIVLSEETNAGDTLKRIESLQGNDIMCDKYILGLSCTLVYICEKVDSIEEIPLHQILTLTNTSRSLLGILSKEDTDLKNIELIRKVINEQLDAINSVEALQVIIPAIIYYSSNKISIEDFSFIYKKVVTLSNKKDHLNMALNLFINESLSKTDVIKCSLEVSTSVPNEISFKMNLFELPHRHDLFLKEYLTKKCEICKTVPRSGAVCVICGTLVCVGQQCCRTSQNTAGECFMHRKSCSGSVGIFFLIRSCALLIISDSIGTIVPAPYVNAYGEHDFDLSSSSALFLNSQLYNGKLTEMWRNYELRDFILRNMDNSRITASSWSML